MFQLPIEWDDVRVAILVYEDSRTTIIERHPGIPHRFRERLDLARLFLEFVSITRKTMSEWRMEAMRLTSADREMLHCVITSSVRTNSFSRSGLSVHHEEALADLEASLGRPRSEADEQDPFGSNDGDVYSGGDA